MRNKKWMLPAPSIDRDAFLKEVLVKKKTLRSVIFTLLLFLPTAALASNFDHLVVFGDSLSDDGNLFAIAPSQVPSDLYYEGRFSNGPVWVEYLAEEDFLDCNLVNHAYGGATTDGVSPPGLIAQVNSYTASATLADNTLFTIWIGANDFLNGSVDYQASADNIGAALEDLAAFGAEHILIVNLPDLGSTPRYIGTAEASSATALSQGFNAALATVVTAFQTDYPDVMIYEFDCFTFLQRVADDPARYGFTNATQVSPSYAIADDFDNSAGYVFWDTIHPTTEAHEMLADRVLSILPEESDDDNACFISSTLFRQ
jgi:phospholipase/lecithinase/hemolysin